MAKKKAKSPATKLAEKIAKKVAAIDGVVAVTLGGSHARGAADDASDVDLGVYYRAEKKPAVSALRELARELDDEGKPLAVTDFGDWGPWINGGAWLTVDGKRVDWLYRELGRVVQTIGEVRAGRVTVDYQPGHPHGFHNHMYMAEIALAVPLADSMSVIRGLQQLAGEYPPGLKRGILERHLWEAGFTLETAAKPAKRGDVAYVAGALYRAVAALVQVLFALNGRWFVNEKGSVAATARFERAPKRFAEIVEKTLGKPGPDLVASVKAIRALEEQVRALAE
jgi:predicted nucleotidyltransferase